MDTSALIRTLSQVIPLSEPLQARINGILKEELLPKKHTLLHEGQIERRIYFIKKGFARAYHFQNDKEYTSWFMGEGDLMVSIYSFFTRKAAQETIELLEDSVIQSVTWEELQELYRDFVEFNIVGRILTEQYYVKSEERAISLRTLSATERYAALIASFPEILKKVSVTHIASYLGISQETLSRIRAKVKL